MGWLLDSNAVIALMRDPRGPVARRVREHGGEDIQLSAIVWHELHFGAFRSQRAGLNLQRLQRLDFPILPFDAEDARTAGAIRAELIRRGTPIGPYDMLIAGQAKARGLTLVTRNIREFARIPDLLVEDWEAP